MRANDCKFIGRLTREPELKYSPSGMAILNMSIACSKNVKNKTTQEWEEKTTFVNFIAFAKKAERFSSLKKGAMVTIEAEYQNGSYEDKGGKKVYTHEFIINDLLQSHFVKGASEQPQEQKQPQPQNANFATEYIPF